MEFHPINEPFEYEGKTIMAVPSPLCEDCVFLSCGICEGIECCSSEREDNVSVKFVEIHPIKAAPSPTKFQVGQKVRDGDFTAVVLVAQPDSNGDIVVESDGQYHIYLHFALSPVPTTKWANLYKETVAYHDSKEQADDAAAVHERIACVEVEWEAGQ